MVIILIVVTPYLSESRPEEIYYAQAETMLSLVELYKPDDFLVSACDTIVENHPNLLYLKVHTYVAADVVAEYSYLRETEMIFVSSLK